MKNMNAHAVAFWGGGAIATVIAIINLLNAIRISLGGSFLREFLPEVILAVVIAVVLYIPAQVLRSKKLVSQKDKVLALVYPVLMFVSLVLILMNGNNLQTQTMAGIVIMVTMVYCVLYGLGHVLQRERK